MLTVLVVNLMDNPGVMVHINELLLHQWYSLKKLKKQQVFVLVK